MLDATRTKYLHNTVSLRIHNSSARNVDIYFDANSTHGLRFERFEKMKTTK